MFKLLFLVAFVNVSYGQEGPFFGGTTCEEAVPITPGDGYITNNIAGDDWYEFTAPCDGDLNLTICPYGDNKQRRIYSGTCDALVLESTASWLACDNPDVPMLEDEVVYIQFDDSWDSDDVVFDIEFENPACPQPTSLSSISGGWDTETLGWFGSGLSYTVIYGPTGFDPDVDGTSMTTTSTFLVITELEELTCYDFYVYADCGGGLVSCFGSGPSTFCTPAVCPVPLLPNETDVTNTTTTLNWSPGDSEDEWDLAWGPEGFLIGGVDETFVDGTPFMSEGLSSLDAATCYDWYVRAVCLEDFGEGPVTVYSLWNGPNEWCTDANCLNPSDGMMISSGGLNATLGWTANNSPEEEEWNLQFGAPGFALGTGTTVTNIPTNPYTLGGLDPGTDYCFYVQAVCGEGEDSLSGWAGPYCFTTAIFCDEPTGLFASSSSGTDASLTWTAGGTETEWDLSWGPSPLDDPEDGTMSDASVFPSLTLSGLTPGETYCYYVRANCGSDADSSSAWAGPYCWTQPALCTTPFGLNMINITNTAAHINFSAPGAESFDVEWGAPCFGVDAGEEIGSVEGTTDSPYYITGLEASTPYWVYVRATCGVDSVSAWAGPILFGTDLANDDPCDAETLVLDGPAVLRHNFDATTLPGEGALAPDASGCYESDGWCAGDGVDRTVWFKFTAPASGQVRVSTFDTSLCVTSSYTEIAIYSTGDCSILDNFVVEGANTLSVEALEAPYGSVVTACGLTAGEDYYVMVNPISYIQTDIHFGISLSSVEEVSAGLGLSPTICAGTTYDLDDAVAGETEGGTWYHPTVAPGNVFSDLVIFPESAGSFDFFYVVSNGCDADTIMTVITTEEGVDAGDDGFFTTCNTYDIILSDHIGGTFDGGGIWEYMGADPDVALSGGLFSPLGMTPAIYTFIYTVSNEFCPTDTVVVTITLTECSDIDESTENTLVVYPNPVVDVLTVENVSIAGNAVIEVLDVEGRVIISNNVSNVFGNYTIDMTNIERGVYFVKVTTDDSIQKVRVVKQ